MKIFTGSDHRGFQLKKNVDEVLKALVAMKWWIWARIAEDIACDYPPGCLQGGRWKWSCHPGSRGGSFCA